MDDFDKFITAYDFPREVPDHPGYFCDRQGTIYRKNGVRIKPFKSSGYDQVYMRDKDNKRSIKGVHQVVSMTFDPSYYPGCVVHHIDENKKNNTDTNLRVESPSEHARHHASPDSLIKYTKEHGPHNKGKKMSPEFCEKCRQSALNRKDRRGFSGNQYVNKDGTRKIKNTSV